MAKATKSIKSTKSETKEIETKKDDKIIAKAIVKKVGVILSILEFVKKGKISQPQLAARLVKRFPDRAPKHLLATIKAQLPGRMSKERNIKISRVDGFYIFATK